MRARTTLAIVCALLLGGAMAAQAQGRITVTKMYITSCEEMGSCELRLTCESGGKEVEMIPAAIATNPDTIPVNKSIEVAKYPATVSCTLFEDDGWFGESWDEAAKSSVSLEGGGNYELKLNNPEQATVVLTLLADSIQSALTAPSAAVPAGGAGGKVSKATPRQFLALFRKEGEPSGHAVVLGLEWPAFQKEMQALASKGVHPTDVETWVDGGKRLWGGIFRSGADSSKVIPGLEWEAFQEQYTKLAEAENDDEKMQLIDMEIYSEKGKNLFAGAFRNGTEMHALWIGQDRPDFLRKWQQLVNQELRLIDLEVYKAGSRNLYAGVFIEAPGSYGIWTGTTWEQFQQKWAGGSGLWQVVSYTESGKRLYDGVVLGGSTQEELPGTLDGPALVAKWRDMLGKGYRLIHLEVVN
jgi:hypothetical protein